MNGKGYGAAKTSRNGEAARGPIVVRCLVKWPSSTVPEIRQLQLEAGPGRCPFCERVLPKSKHRKPLHVCWREECRRAFDTAHSRAFRFRKSHAAQPENR